jgi:hypothetical protein
MPCCEAQSGKEAGRKAALIVRYWNHLSKGVYIMSEAGVFEEDFRYFNEGTETKAECLRCHAVVDAINTDRHRAECPNRQTC